MAEVIKNAAIALDSESLVAVKPKRVPGCVTTCRTVMSGRRLHWRIKLATSLERAALSSARTISAARRQWAKTNWGASAITRSISTEGFPHLVARAKYAFAPCKGNRIVITCRHVKVHSSLSGPPTRCTESGPKRLAGSLICARDTLDYFLTRQMN